MQKSTLFALAAATTALGGCATYGSADYGPWGYYDRSYYTRYGAYDWDRPDPSYNAYYADRYYRTGRYNEYRLSGDDRIYRGNDGRYYCRRSDGTTGLIVGGIAGGVLGNIIAPGGSKTLGTVLGAIGGGAVGAAVDSSSGDVRCR